MKNTIKMRPAILLLLSACLATACLAEPAPTAAAKTTTVSNSTDPQQNIPLTITADQTQMDFKSGINVYQGHVYATHGKSHLSGDQITTYRNLDNKIQKVVTVGKQATLHSEEDSTSQPVDATADTIIFYPIDHLADLIGHATAIQGKNIIHAPFIRYNTQTKQMQANSTANTRMHILIYNDQSSQTKSPSSDKPAGTKP